MVAENAKYEIEANERPNCPGFTSHVQNMLEMPSDVMAKTLLPGEKVLDSFDVMYDDIYIPLYERIWLCLKSCGLFLLVLLNRHIRRNRLCGSFCLPSKTIMHRGKMYVTSQNRGICWNVKSTEYRTGVSFCNLLCAAFTDICEPPVEYDVETSTEIHNLKNLRQVTQWYGSKTHCSCLSLFKLPAYLQCNAVEGGLQLHFQTFHSQHHSLLSLMSAFQVSSSYSFAARVQSLVNTGLKQLFSWDIFRYQNEIHIVTSSADVLYPPSHEERLTQLSELHHRFLSLLPVAPLYAPSAVATKDVLVEQNDVQIVDDDGNVRLPSHFIKLMNEEEIVASHGYVYRMTTWDWVLSIVTFGLYYLLNIRIKRFHRTATVLTTRRILAVDIYQRAGVIPDHMNNFSVLIRSFVPGDILAGYVATDPGIGMYYAMFSSVLRCCFTPFNRVTSSLFCNAGSVSIDMYVASGGIEFAKSMQNVICRSTLPPISIENIHRASDADACLSDYERNFLPLLATEKVISRHVGNGAKHPLYRSTYVPMCSGACNNDSLCCFPGFCMCVTCGNRPFLKTTDILLTDHTMYQLSFIRTNPWVRCREDESRMIAGNG